jgi:hypothetical protein
MLTQVGLHFNRVSRAITERFVKSPLMTGGDSFSIPALRNIGMPTNGTSPSPFAGD